MLTSTQLKKIVSEARPLIEQQLDLTEQIAGLREVVTAAGGDWSQLKALVKAQIQDERDEAGDVAEEMVSSGAAPNAASVYNVLSKIARRGRVSRSEGIYYPLKENEPPEGGSDTGGAGTPPIESQRRLLDL